MKKIARVLGIVIIATLIGSIPALAINFNQDKFTQEETEYMMFTLINMQSMMQTLNNLDQLFPKCPDPLDTKRYQEWYYVMHIQFQAIEAIGNEFIGNTNIPKYFSKIDKEYRACLDNLVKAAQYFDAGYQSLNPEIIKKGLPYWTEGCNQFGKIVPAFIKLLEDKNGGPLM